MSTSKVTAANNYERILLKLLRCHKGKSESFSLNGDKQTLQEVFVICGSKVIVDELTSLIADSECKYSEFEIDTRVAVATLVLNNALNFYRNQRCSRVTREMIGELMFLFNKTHNIRAVQHKHEPRR